MARRLLQDDDFNFEAERRRRRQRERNRRNITMLALCGVAGLAVIVGLVAVVIARSGREAECVAVGNVDREREVKFNSKNEAVSPNI
jgi:hypothetical protein